MTTLSNGGTMKIEIFHTNSTKIVRKESKLVRNHEAFILQIATFVDLFSYVESV